MRKGNNQSKDILIHLRESSHRVIIPLYIPNLEGYYKDAFEIFKMCLFSIVKTSATYLKISVISNNTCERVNQKLLQLQNEGHIDELIIEKEDIGKINSILKSLRTTEERLVTITDADVLFCNGWEEAVVEVFNAFPNAGAVCPVPVFRKHLNLTSNIWMKYLFSKKLYFRQVKNTEAMTKFAKSIGWPWLDEKYKDVIGTLQSKNGTIAVLGCSHFVATYKTEVFSELPKKNSQYKLGGNSEFLYTDEPVIKRGAYRLATYDNYAYHLGNHLEEWMEKEFVSLANQEKRTENYESLSIIKKKPIRYFLSEKFFKKIFYFKKIQMIILRYKGLSKKQINDFIS
ncbi:glycosyltransferase family 2 protein [Flavobacterium sp. J27]|uniref:glycosyltransferase family 2 protein n=1 Tax=Flavobacterium sp. J27 TaxID=2060419 RepID=UPI00103261F9|nr:glycosyltransferase family 2 protein [Flavobacterium sp. J27]